MTIAELRDVLKSKGVQTTSKMRKAELESLLHDVNLTELAVATPIEQLSPRFREYAAPGNFSSFRAFRRAQPTERDRQKRARQIKRMLRAQGEVVCMNPGTRRHKKG